MAKLRVSREEAATVLDEQAHAGEELLAGARSVNDSTQYDEWKFARRRWVNFTTDALNHVYADTAAAGEFNHAMSRMVFSATGRWEDYVREGYQDVKTA